MKLIPLVVYKVTKNSSDDTFEVNDLIWKSKNGDIMCPNKGGWISMEEYQAFPEMCDFEAVVDDEYFVFSTESQESIISYEYIEKQIQRQKNCKDKL